MPSDLDKLAASISKLAEVHDRRLGEIGSALESLSLQVKNLGNGNAMTEQGAIEYLAGQVEGGLDAIAEAIRDTTNSEE